MKTEITPEEILELSDETRDRIKGLIALGYNFDPVVQAFCDWASEPKNMDKLHQNLFNYSLFCCMLPMEQCQKALRQFVDRMSLVTKIINQTRGEQQNGNP